MAVTYGFFNSVNGDRKYNAEQMSEYFRGIINEGVYQHLDCGLAVTAGTGLAVNVAAGRAIIQNRWVQNSAAMSLTIAAASETYARKDAVVIRLNWSSRSISIAVKTGTPAASPVAPSMTRNSTTYEMALAYVNVAANATSVTVTDKRSDSTVCGWVTVAQSTSGEVDAQLNAMKTGFDGVVYSSPAEQVIGSDTKLQGEITKAFDSVGYKPISTADGTSGYIDCSVNPINPSSVVSSTTYWHLILDCAENDRYTVINMSCGTKPRSWCFIDSSNNVLAVATNGKLYENIVIRAPKGATKVVFNYSSGDSFALGEKSTNYINRINNDIDIITWDLGQIQASSGKYLTGISPYLVSEMITSNVPFTVTSKTQQMRYFVYDKTTGAYVGGVNWQSAPFTASFNGQSSIMCVIAFETNADAMAAREHIEDYVTITFDSDKSFIEFLPITDVYIGDVQQRIYFNELARYNENEGYFVVTASGATYPVVTYTDRYIQFVPTSAATITITVSYYIHDGLKAAKTLTVHCKPTAFANKKVMFLGDSYTEMGGMVRWFKDHNTDNVTLYGTRSTTIDNVTYQHEGRSGWTAGNYISSANVGAVTNPFYNPTSETFDFSYYMAHDGSSFTDVQVVNILLGRNSGFPVSNMDNLDIIVASIKAYNPNIIVVLMCDSNLAADNSGAGKYLQNVHTANKQSHVYNSAFYEKYKNDSSVVMCFQNLNLDNVYDFTWEEVDSSIVNSEKVKMYTDNVHPGNLTGLAKFGIALNGLLRNYFNS